MIGSRERLCGLMLVALCVTAPVLAATSSNFQDATEPGLESWRLEHRMPMPEAAAEPDAAAKSAAPIVRANPLWAMPLSALTTTRERPLFSPSRRPPAPVMVRAPVAPPARPPPPLAPEHLSLVLVGTVRGETDSIAVFVDSATRTTVRLHTGEAHMGWILHSVNRHAAELQKGDRTETLELPVPGVQQARAPLVATPPPAPPPPPGHRERNPRKSNR
jgi:general secretion pathway protein N